MSKLAKAKHPHETPETYTCSVSDCMAQAARGVREGRPLCWAHYSQAREGLPLLPIRERPASPLERLILAGERIGGADDDEEYHRAKDNLRKAAVAYVGHLLLKQARPDWP